MFNVPVECTAVEFHYDVCHVKTRMMICLAALTQCTDVTDMTYRADVVGYIYRACTASNDSK